MSVKAWNVTGRQEAILPFGDGSGRDGAGREVGGIQDEEHMYPVDSLLVCVEQCV